MVRESPATTEAQRRVQAACASAWGALCECKGDPHTLAVAFQGAVIAFELRGNAETAKDWKKDGRTLSQGPKAIKRHKERRLDKLALQSFPARGNTCRTNVSPQGGAELVMSPDDVLAVVLHAIEQAAADLDQPDPRSAALLRRKDAQFLRLLDIEFRNRGLPRPTAKRLRAPHEIGTGESFIGDDAPTTSSAPGMQSPVASGDPHR